MSKKLKKIFSVNELGWEKRGCAKDYYEGFFESLSIALNSKPSILGYPDYLNYNDLVKLGLSKETRHDYEYNGYAKKGDSSIYRRELVVDLDDGHRLITRSEDSDFAGLGKLTILLELSGKVKPVKLHRLHYLNTNQHIINELLTDLKHIFTRSPVINTTGKELIDDMKKWTKSVVLVAWNGRTVDFTTAPVSIDRKAIFYWSGLNNKYINKIRTSCSNNGELYFKITDDKNDTMFSMVIRSRPCIVKLKNDDGTNSPFLVNAIDMAVSAMVGNNKLIKSNLSSSRHYFNSFIQQYPVQLVDTLLNGGVVSLLNEQLKKRENLFMDETGDGFKSFLDNLCESYHLTILK